MFTWIELDLPSVPEKFIKQAFDVAKQATHEDVSHFGLISDSPKSLFERKLIINGKEHNTRHQWSGAISEEWEEWVRGNIIPTYLNTGVRVSVGKETDWHGAHCDSFKGPPKKFVYKLYYLIDAGGDDAETVFYKEKNKPFKRTTDQETLINNYDDLEVVDRVKLPPNKWVLLNTSVLHGVENVTGPRTNLVVVIDIDQVDVDIVLKG